MKAYTLCLFFLLAFTIVVSCEEETLNDKLVNKEISTDSLDAAYFNQQVLFMFESENHAWGYSYGGWIVDSLGNMYSYNKPDTWTKLDSVGCISDSAMKANLVATDSICYHIDIDSLKTKFSLISDASLGDLTDPEHRMYDAGSWKYYAFQYDSAKQMYQSVLIRKDGDYLIENTSNAANEIYLWLHSLMQFAF